MEHTFQPNLQPEPKRETFIVQNITLGYHFVSDIGLQFSPRQVMDLTWEDQKIILGSKNLKESLRTGVLRKLSEAEYEKTMQLQYEKEKKQLLKEQKKKQPAQYTKKRDGDREFLAETFDVDKASKRGNELDVTGTANHPMSYVAAFEIAQKIAEDSGDELTAEEFSTMVERNPKVVPSLLSQTRTASLDQGHKVYYAAADGGNISVRQAKMTNYNRDLRYGNEEESYVADRILSQLDFVEDDNDAEFKGIDLNINAPYEEDEDFAEEIIVDDEE
jgi:hypothetical protein